jgi:quercetin dioxygenase-like cupin family protein
LALHPRSNIRDLTKNEFMKTEKTILTDQIDYQEGSFTNKIIFDRGDFKIFLFALKAGQEIRPHSTPVNAFLTIVEGEGMVRIGEDNFTLKTGESILLPKDILHYVRADRDFKMMLIK